MRIICGEIPCVVSFLKKIPKYHRKIDTEESVVDKESKYLNLLHNRCIRSNICTWYMYTGSISVNYSMNLDLLGDTEIFKHITSYIRTG